MGDPVTLLAMASFAVVALVIASLAVLKGWHGWLEVKRLEVSRTQVHEPSARAPSPAARIELADLKERVRKLEAIASGVEL